jgi:16S rRNA (cytosine1402-N4)-methyltransferase
MSFRHHIPVLYNEAIEFLAVRPGGTYLDATCGAGGHSAGICERLSGPGRLIAMDQDEKAQVLAKQRLKDFGDRVTFYHGNFRRIDRVLDELKIESIDGALADLGVSSMQFDDPARGFSFEGDAELDMRMDQTQGDAAATLIRRARPEELARILRDFGEQPYPGRIARSLVEAARGGEALTGQSVRRIVHNALPGKAKRGAKIDPATRVFMALRIAVNEELASLEEFLAGVHGRLRPGGRLVVISFHSLEDRIVKRFFKEKEKGCICPKELPQCLCGLKPSLKVLTRRPMVPGAPEVEGNPRSRSAKLRAAEKK